MLNGTANTMNGLKISKESYVRITALSVSVTLGSIIGAITFYLIGLGREFFQTSTPEELYGVWGWFTIPAYLLYIGLLSGILGIVVIIFTSPTADRDDKGVNEE